MSLRCASTSKSNKKFSIAMKTSLCLKKNKKKKRRRRRTMTKNMMTTTIMIAMHNNQKTIKVQKVAIMIFMIITWK